MTAQPLMFTLDQNPNKRGLRCDHDGLFLGKASLLERDSANHFRPRAQSEIRKILSETYRAETDWTSRVRSVGVVAAALNKGEIARAMIAAVLMRLPDPDGAIQIADVDNVLGRAGFDTDEPRDARGRWTSGGSADEGQIIPAQAVIAEPLIEPLLGEAIRPFPGTIDVVPPAAIPNGQQFPRA